MSICTQKNYMNTLCFYYVTYFHAHTTKRLSFLGTWNMVRRRRRRFFSIRMSLKAFLSRKYYTFIHCLCQHIFYRHISIITEPFTYTSIIRKVWKERKESEIFENWRLTESNPHVKIPPCVYVAISNFTSHNNRKSFFFRNAFFNMPFVPFFICCWCPSTVIRLVSSLTHYFIHISQKRRQSLPFFLAQSSISLTSTHTNVM